MRVVALMGPSAREHDLAPFRGAGVDLFVEDVAGSQADAALIFGGDGTIHRHLRALVEMQVATLVVPTGSGNDFARSLRIRNRQDALAAWEKFLVTGENVRRVDLGLIENHAIEPTYFCCVGGAGLDSATNAIANRMSPWWRAHGGYALAAVPALLRWRAVGMRVEAASTKIAEPGTMCVFANAPSYGDGMRIAPRAQMDDGLLDLCFVRGASKLLIARKFSTIYGGTHLQLPEVEYAQVPTVRLETETPLDVYADGEFVCQTPVGVGVKAKALRVIC